MTKGRPIEEVRARTDFRRLGRQMHALIEELFPICRSITGEGLRATLRILQRLAPLTLHEVPTGTRVLDWTIPKEWSIRDAYIADTRGRRIVDFQRSNLHVVNYSVPVRARMTLGELKPHLHSLPEKPDWIPYRTSYYDETWGFCLSHHDLERLRDESYEVMIDTSLEPGSLTYGELVLPGRTEEEVLISCHVCHPSLANDNLSGAVLALFLSKLMASVERRYAYRFLFVPGTIGSIAWLARNADAVSRIRHGLVVACVGDAGSLTYKKSRRGNADIDRAAALVVRAASPPGLVLDFTPYGYDERQYCSPGFDLPVGSLTRTPHGRYPEYHTSADDLGFVRADSLADSLSAYLDVLSILERNVTYRNTSPHGEPQLGRRGLYRLMGGAPDPGVASMAMLWVLNQADGSHSLLDVAERSGMPFDALRAAAEALIEQGLLEAAS